MADGIRKRTIADAINKRRVVQSRMRKNIKLIGKYSGQKIRLSISTEEERISKVESLLQANKDLFDEALKLTRFIEKTNAHTNVTTEDGAILSVSDLTFYKRQSRKNDRRGNSDETKGFVNLLLQSYYTGRKHIGSESKVVSGMLRIHDKEIEQKINSLLSFLNWIEDELNEINHVTYLVE